MRTLSRTCVALGLVALLSGPALAHSRAAAEAGEWGAAASACCSATPVFSKS